MNNTLRMFIVYDQASDAPPGAVVVRGRSISAGRDVPDSYACYFRRVDQARAFVMRDGLAMISRHPTDDPAILEVWL